MYRVAPLMDQRLFRIAGHRPQRLTNRDVPALARAIQAAIRRQANIDRHVINDVYCIRFYSPSFELLVRSEDWAKVVPFLKDGTFDPLISPVSQVFVSDRRSYYDVSVLDRTDPELFDRLVRILTPLFP